MHDPALAGAIVERPEAGSIRAEILHDATQAILDPLVDFVVRTRGQVRREIREQGLELQTLGEAALSAPTLGTVHEQRHDEPGLDEQQPDASDDVAAVALPDGRLVEQDDTALGQKPAIYPPALDLSI